MPPVLDPPLSTRDGLAFLGLSLSRNHLNHDSSTSPEEGGHHESATHQTAFDFNALTDRTYQYFYSTNDDGWLMGGGEPGAPHSYKLASKDSAHVEVMRIGTYRPEWGGLSVDEVVQAIQAGHILIPIMEVVPTSVVANADKPPEIEVRFDLEAVEEEKSEQSLDDFALPPLPLNWQLRFVHNQLFKHFSYPSRFCPGAFHATLVRKAEFRSEQHRREYFAMCDQVVQEWKRHGPQPLIPDVGASSSVTVVSTSSSSSSVVSTVKENDPATMNSGLWLFTDRKTITHHFLPNFLPPYDTPETKQLILDMIAEEWDEQSLSWKPASATRTQQLPHAVVNNDEDDPLYLGEFASALNDSVSKRFPFVPKSLGWLDNFFRTRILKPQTVVDDTTRYLSDGMLFIDCQMDRMFDEEIPARPDPIRKEKASVDTTTAMHNEKKEEKEEEEEDYVKVIPLDSTGIITGRDEPILDSDTIIDVIIGNGKNNDHPVNPEVGDSDPFFLGEFAASLTQDLPKPNSILAGTTRFIQNKIHFLDDLVDRMFRKQEKTTDMNQGMDDEVGLYPVHHYSP